MRQGEEELKEYGASAQQSRPEANGLADSAEALDADSIGRVFRSVRPRAPLDPLRPLGVPDGPDAHGPSVINATLYSTHYPVGPSQSVRCIHRRSAGVSSMVLSSIGILRASVLRYSCAVLSSACLGTGACSAGRSATLLRTCSRWVSRPCLRQFARIRFRC